MRNNRVVSRLARQLNRVDRFRHRADLVQLDQNRIGDAFVDSARQPLCVGYNRSSPTSWIFFFDVLLPTLIVSCFHPAQSSSAMPSSIDTIGYFSVQPVQ